MKKEFVILLFSSILCFFVSIPVFAEEQASGVVSEESVQEIVVAEEENSSEQKEVFGEETLVSEEEGEEGCGQQTVTEDDHAAALQEKQEDVVVAEAGTEIGEEKEESPSDENAKEKEISVSIVVEAGTPVDGEKKNAEIPASSEQEQTDFAPCLSENTEEVIEQRETPMLKASVRRMAAAPAASTNITGAEAAAAAGSTSTAAETQEAENQTATAESGEADKSTAVTAEGSRVPAGFTGVVKETGDGPWYYYRNGKKDDTYAGFAQDEERNWYYVESGEVNRRYTGVAYREKNDTWYFFRNGELDWSYTGIAKDHPEDKSKTQWYRVEGGEVNLDFDGLAKRPENKTWYFLRDGILDWTYTGIGQNPTSKHWYRVKYGEVDFGFKGLAKRPEDKTWYFLKKGEVDWGYTGIGQNPTSKHWYRVKDGIVDFSFKGVAKRPENGIWYYLTRGELDWDYTGIAKDPEDQSWYRIEKGEVNWGYTGGALRPENNTWYYIKNGKLDWSYTGLDTDENNNTYGYRKGERVFGKQVLKDGEEYNFAEDTGALLKDRWNLFIGDSRTCCLSNEIAGTHVWTNFATVDSGWVGNDRFIAQWGGGSTSGIVQSAVDAIEDNTNVFVLIGRNETTVPSRTVEYLQKINSAVADRGLKGVAVYFCSCGPDIRGNGTYDIHQFDEYSNAVNCSGVTKLDPWDELGTLAASWPGHADFHYDGPTSRAWYNWLRDHSEQTYVWIKS